MLSVLFVLLAGSKLAYSYDRPGNVTGLGYYLPTQNTDPAIIEALSRPRYINSVAFTGFNASYPLSNQFSGTLDSSHTWHLDIAFSTTNVSNSTVEVYQYAVDYAGERYPNDMYPLNSSDWQICTSIIQGSFAPQVLRASGNDSDASCVPYLGQACVDAWIMAYNAAPIDESTGCRSAPSPYNIQQCKNVVTDGSFGIASAAISNATIPGLTYDSNNNSYVDPSTGAVYTLSTVPTEGLLSRQYFAYEQVVQSSSTSPANDARGLQVLGLAFTPNRRMISNIEGQVYQQDSRLLCGRANTPTGTATGTATSTATSTSTSATAGTATASATGTARSNAHTFQPHSFWFSAMIVALISVHAY